MDQINDGRPAFPCTTMHDFKGMSIRDYFAGQALAGIMANPELTTDAGYIAKWSYLNADAMLAERQKERE